MDERELDRMWMRILDPEELRPLLILAALYVLAFEQFRTNTVDRLKTFFADGWDENGPIIGKQYKQEVTSLGRNEFWTSLRWHLNSSIIDEADYAKIEACNKLRNMVVHEMLEWLAGEDSTDDLLDSLGVLHELIDKIETWWILNFEIPIDPQFDNVEVSSKDVTPGPTLGLKMLYDVAMGTPEESLQYLEVISAIAQNSPNRRSPGSL